MLRAFQLPAWIGLQEPLGGLASLLGALKDTLRSRNQRRLAREDWAVLRSMSDRELADLAIGRGDVTRDADPCPHP